GLDDGHARGLDRMIEPGLLGDHRLRLDDLPYAVPLCDLEHERVDLGRRLRVEHRRAVRACILVEDREPDVEVVERALANFGARVARAFEIVELGDRLPSCRNELALELGETRLQLCIVELRVRALLEVHRGDLHGLSGRRRLSDMQKWGQRRLSRASSNRHGRPLAKVVSDAASPARTSAMCSTFVASPRRRSRPSMFSMQPRSPSTTASAPLVTTCWHLLSARRAEISPNLTANVPPKPQHISLSAISVNRTPSIVASSARGCDL